MKGVLSCLLALVLVFSITPSVFAVGGKTIYVDAINGNDTSGDGTNTAPFKTAKKAVIAAASGDTIQLAAGCYSLYEVCGKDDKSNSKEYTKNKDLTFIGAGPEETKWGIGAKVPDPTYFGTEYNGDYSFDGAGTITFQNMTLQSGSADYLGFIRADNTVVENCTINGKTFYWGYESATFTNTTFNCPSGDYAIWTYSSPTMTFDRCTFNSSGKVINVYNEGGTPDVTIDFKNCTVNSNNPDSKDSKSVLNINDRLVNSFKINISGTNIINGIKADGIAKTEGSHKEYDKNQVDVTCSKLFEFNTKYDKPSANQYANSGKTVVSIDGVTVWENGKMVDHKNSDGYKDNAFTVTKGEWTTNEDGTISRTVTKTCKYCGYEENVTEYRVTYYYSNGTAKPTDSPKTGDNSSLALWFALLFVSGGAAIGTTVVSRKKKYNR